MKMNFPRGIDILYVIVTLILIPTFYIYEVALVIPTVLAEDNQKRIFHTGISVFLLHNVLGNLVRGMLGPGTVQGRILHPSLAWRFCLDCECAAPPRSWHCDTCKVCVLKRDHHCNFFGCCVGYFNHRFFCMFVFYVFMSTLYALYFNVIFVVYYIDWSIAGWLSFLRFFFPIVSVATEMNKESLFSLMFVINVIVTAFTGFLLFYHGRTIVKGQVTPEYKHKLFNYDNGWKSNLLDVFGKNWYLTVISPLLPSPLLGNGVHWKSKDSPKGD